MEIDEGLTTGDFFAASSGLDDCARVAAAFGVPAIVAIGDGVDKLEQAYKTHQQQVSTCKNLP